MFEVDSKLKLLRPDQGGVATRPLEDLLWDEKRRQTDVCANGLGMSRIIWQDFWPPHRAKAVRRLAREYAVTRERYGETLPPELEEFARRMRGRRRSA